jgi:hypothetical protein
MSGDLKCDECDAVVQFKITKLTLVILIIKTPPHRWRFALTEIAKNH